MVYNINPYMNVKDFCYELLKREKELDKKRWIQDSTKFKESHDDVYGAYRGKNKRGHTTTTVKLKNGNVGTVVRYVKDTQDNTVALYEAYIKALKKQTYCGIDYGKTLVSHRLLQQDHWLYKKFLGSER